MTPYQGHIATCPVCAKEYARHHEERDLFHQMWDDASEAPHYRRSFWDRFARLLRL